MTVRHTSNTFIQPAILEFVLAGLCGIGIGALLVISPILGVLGGLGIVIVTIGLMQPIWICYGLIVATVLTSGMVRGQVIPYFIPNEPILVLGTILACPYILTRKKAQPPARLLWIGLIGLALGNSIIPFLIYLTRQVPLTTKETMVLLAPLQYILIFWIFRNIPQNEIEVRRVLRLLFGCAALVAFIGLLQAARLGAITNLLHTWYPSPHEEIAVEYGRVSSVLGAWNSLGTFLAINLLMIRAIYGVKPPLMKSWSLLLAAVIIASCLLASGSYAGIIGFILGLGLLELQDRRGRKSLIILVICLAITAIPLWGNISQRLAYQFRGDSWIPTTLAFRFKVWEEVFIPVIQKTWLLGYHPVMPTSLTWLYPESQYFSLLLRGGIISLIAHLTWISTSLVWLYKQKKATNGLAQGIANGAFTIFIVLSFMGLTNSVFTFSGVIEYLLISMGLLASICWETG